MYWYELISVKQNFNEDKKMTLRYWDIWIESKLVNWHGPLLLFLPLWKEVTLSGEAVSPLLKVFKTPLAKTWSRWSDLRAGLAFSRLDQILPEPSTVLWICQNQLSISKRNVFIRLLKPLAGTIIFSTLCTAALSMDDTSVMLSSASLLPAGKCYCLGFCKSWDIRANQRLVGPVKIWFPNNQVQEENCGWLVGWFWMAALQLE